MLKLINPFPGFEPYTAQGGAYYAGQAWQTSRFLGFCSERNFSLLQGSVGSGKTSFIRGDVMPALRAGYTARGKSNWQIAEMIPGRAPLAALSAALADLVSAGLQEGEKSDPILPARFETILRSGKFGIVEILEQNNLVSKGNIFLFIDQLDDLFTDSFQESSSNPDTDTAIFVDRLVEVINQTAYPVTIVAAAKSERINDFVRFPRLMQMMKENTYILSQPGRGEVVEVFRKIAESGALTFSEEFIKRVYSALQEKSVNLGRFQHALKHSVDEMNRAKVKNLISHLELGFRQAPVLGDYIKSSKVLSGLLLDPRSIPGLKNYEQENYLMLDELVELPTLADRSAMVSDFHQCMGQVEPYEITWEQLSAVGGFDHSIEKQMESIYQGLTVDDQKVCRLVFQSLTGINPFGEFSIQRSIQEVSKITQQDSSSVVRVLRQFTNDRCGVVRVLPSTDIRARLDQLEVLLDRSADKLSEHSEISISQPVVLQSWPRLREWIAEEHQNALMYLDIVKDVASREPSYEGIKLSTVWAWYESCIPHAGWANRYKGEYDVGFEVVRNFILNSKTIADRNLSIQLDEQHAQAARSARMRQFILVGLVLAITTGIVVLYLTKQAVEAQSAAKAAREKAQLQTEKATREQTKADSARDVAAKAISDSRISRIVARQEQDVARESKAEAERMNKVAQQALSEQVIMDRRNQLLKRNLEESEKSIRVSNLELGFLKQLSEVNMLSDNARRRAETQLDSEIKIAANIIDMAYATLLKVKNDPRFDTALTTGPNREGLRRTFNSVQKRVISSLATVNQNVESPTRYLFDNIRYGTAMDIFPGPASRLVIGTDQNKIWRLDFNSMNDLDVFKFSITEDFKLPGGVISGIRSIRYDLSGKTLYSGTVDGFIKFNKGGRTIRPSTENVMAIFPVAEDEFITADRSGIIHYFRDNRAVDSVLLNNKIQAIDFSRDGRFILVNGVEKQLVRIDLQPTESKRRFSLQEISGALPSEALASLKIIPSRSWVALGLLGGAFLIYDLNENKVIYRDDNRHFSSINCMELDDKRNLLITGGQDKIINVWNLAEFQEPNGRMATTVEPITFKELQPVMDLQLSSTGWLFAITRGQADEKINRFAAGRLSIWSTDLKLLKRRHAELRKNWLIPNFNLESNITD